MKNLVIYYILIIVPIVLIVLFPINNLFFAIFLLIYAIPYRALIDGYRLVNKKIIEWNEIWKLLIPYRSSKYFKALYYI
jgi:hypothetical protein